jgi:hypothetical protein
MNNAGHKELGAADGNQQIEKVQVKRYLTKKRFNEIKGL